MSASTEDAERSSGDAILETKDLTKRFGGLTAVDSVNYSLASEGIQCIIGPNGAGKSTFFKLITGRLSPTEGTIRYRGEDITDLEPYERVRRGLSMKFQDVSVYPELTVKENFRIAVQRHTSDYEDAIDDLLDVVQLQGKRDAMVGSLSHGQQQWLEIGMATAVEPNLLLLDEPTAGMTVDETKETGGLIQSLADEGMAVIVVEHDINFVRQIAETVTVLHNGQIFTEGSVEEIEENEDVKRIYLGEE
jgi:branched-chain amino acid transport system ATP-binding protein